MRGIEDLTDCAQKWYHKWGGGGGGHHSETLIMICRLDKEQYELELLRIVFKNCRSLSFKFSKVGGRLRILKTSLFVR